MTGRKRAKTLIQPRDLRLLSELGVMHWAERDQLREAAGFGSVTRINARLLALSRYGALKQFFFGARLGSRKALYSLSAAGAALANVPFVRVRRHSGEELVTDL